MTVDPEAIAGLIAGSDGAPFTGVVMVRWGTEMDDRGHPAVSGVYLVRLTTDAGLSGTAKATLAR